VLANLKADGRAVAKHRENLVAAWHSLQEGGKQSRWREIYAWLAEGYGSRKARPSRRAEEEIRRENFRI
jgi:hypothetical protein